MFSYKEYTVGTSFSKSTIELLLMNDRKYLDITEHKIININSRAIIFDESLINCTKHRDLIT